jgi:hypothetical protein
MKRFAAILPLVLMTGCVTSQMIDVARGEHVVIDGKRTSVRKPIPEAYAFLPATVAVDAGTLPFWVVVIIGVNTGLMRQPY